MRPLMTPAPPRRPSRAAGSCPAPGLALLGLLAAWIALPPQPAHAARGEEPSVLEVRGTGEVRTPPDLAFVRVGVTAENKQADGAQAEVNKVANRIVAEVKQLDIEERDIQTVELQIGPVYSNEPSSSGRREPRIRGYQASTVVNVTVRELGNLGKVVDAALGAGGNRVEGIQFALKDETPARNLALERAVKDAKSKATTLSKALGTELGEVRSLREGGASVVPAGAPRVRMLAMDSMEASTAPSPGEIVVRAEVLLEYALD